MPNRTFAESILTLFVRRDRAAVMYGDLIEIANTRGHIWFIAAYLRTLADLTWRTVAAVILAMSLYQLLGNTLFHGIRGPAGPHLPMPLLFWFEPRFLWFVFPFAAMHFGIRDRFVLLTAIAAFGTTMTFIFLPRFSFPGVVVALALAASLFLLKGWRKQAAVLAATLAIEFWSTMAAGTVTMFLRSHGYVPDYGQGSTGLEPMLAFRGSIVLSAYLCVWLHRRLLTTEANACPPNKSFA